MNSFDKAVSALEALLDGMADEASNPKWYTTDDHPDGGYDLYSCSIAPFIYWLWYQEPFVNDSNSRGIALGKYGIMAYDFKSLKNSHFENVIYLLRYALAQNNSFRDTLTKLDRGDGLRIIESLNNSGYYP